MLDSPQQNGQADDLACVTSRLQQEGIPSWDEYLKISHGLLSRVAPPGEAHFLSDADRLRFEEKLAGRMRMVAVFRRLDAWRATHKC